MSVLKCLKADLGKWKLITNRITFMNGHGCLGIFVKHLRSNKFDFGKHTPTPHKDLCGVDTAMTLIPDCLHSLSFLKQSTTDFIVHSCHVPTEGRVALKYMCWFERNAQNRGWNHSTCVEWRMETLAERIDCYGTHDDSWKDIVKNKHHSVLMMDFANVLRYLLKHLLRVLYSETFERWFGGLPNLSAYHRYRFKHTRLNWIN